jgi:hypothetical protein
MFDDIVIEVARIEREARERVRAKLAAQQLGEAWRDLPVSKEDSREDDRK